MRRRQLIPVLSGFALGLCTAWACVPLPTAEADGGVCVTAGPVEQTVYEGLCGDPTSTLFSLADFDSVVAIEGLVEEASGFWRASGSETKVAPGTGEVRSDACVAGLGYRFVVATRR